MIHNYIKLSAIAIVLFAISIANTYSQERIPMPQPSQHASVTQRIGLTDITVDYHRPAINGRVVWGKLVPYDQVWRAGANENTTITFTDPVKIAGRDVPAGSYAIHMIPSEKEFTVIINKFAKAWGSFFYKEDEDLMRFKVTPQAADNMEYLSYNFETSEPNKARVVMHWEKLKVPFEVEVNVHEVTVASLKENLRGLNGFFWQSFNTAANYCLNNNTHLEDGEKWADRSIQLNRNFNNLSTKAGLLEIKGNKKEADQLMTDAFAIANEADINNYGYIMLQNKKVDKAIEVFKLNVERYPDSWNVYDSLAEGYMNKGENELSRKYYQKALDMVKDENQKTRINNTLKTLASN